MKLYTLQQVSIFCLLLFFSRDVAAQTTYSVKKGETVYGIAKAHGMTVDDFLKANPKITGRIVPGQQLNIPSSRAIEQNKATAVDEHVGNSVTPNAVHKNKEASDPGDYVKGAGFSLLGEGEDLIQDKITSGKATPTIGGATKAIAKGALIDYAADAIADKLTTNPNNKPAVKAAVGLALEVAVVGKVGVIAVAAAVLEPGTFASEDEGPNPYREVKEYREAHGGQSPTHEQIKYLEERGRWPSEAAEEYREKNGSYDKDFDKLSREEKTQSLEESLPNYGENSGEIPPTTEVGKPNGEPTREQQLYKDERGFLPSEAAEKYREENGSYPKDIDKMSESERKQYLEESLPNYGQNTNDKTKETLVNPENTTGTQTEPENNEAKVENGEESKSGTDAEIKSKTEDDSFWNSDADKGVTSENTATENKLENNEDKNDAPEETKSGTNADSKVESGSNSFWRDNEKTETNSGNSDRKEKGNSFFDDNNEAPAAKPVSNTAKPMTRKPLTTSGDLQGQLNNVGKSISENAESGRNSIRAAQSATSSWVGSTTNQYAAQAAAQQAAQQAARQSASSSSNSSNNQTGGAGGDCPEAKAYNDKEFARLKAKGVYASSSEFAELNINYIKMALNYCGSRMPAEERAYWQKVLQGLETDMRNAEYDKPLNSR